MPYHGKLKERMEEYNLVVSERHRRGDSQYKVGKGYSNSDGVIIKIMIIFLRTIRICFLDFPPINIFNF